MSQAMMQSQQQVQVKIEIDFFAIKPRRPLSMLLHICIP